MKPAFRNTFDALDVPFHQIRDMISKPRHLIYGDLDMVPPDPSRIPEMLESYGAILTDRMVPQHVLIPASREALILSNHLISTRSKPEEDQQTRDAVAATFQLINNAMNMINIMSLGPCGSVYAHQIVVTLNIYPAR
jgi:hypothetical protein